MKVISIFIFGVKWDFSRKVGQFGVNNDNNGGIKEESFMQI